MGLSMGPLWDSRLWGQGWRHARKRGEMETGDGGKGSDELDMVYIAVLAAFAC